MPARSRIAKLVLMLASAAAALAAAEGALRLAGISYPNFYQPDPARGWALRPGAEGWWTKEGRAHVRINRDGMRDQEHPRAKPPGELRIAVLGDSCAEALQVPAEETFWALLERELARCPAAAGRRIEALNFGVSGYGTAQELLTLREKVWAYDPDVVLLAFYAGNDVRNNYRPLEQDPALPYFELRSGPAGPAGPGGDDRLVLDASFRDGAGYRLRRSPPGRLLYALFDRSRLLQAAKQAKARLDGRIGAWKARKRETGAVLQELGLDNAVYAPPADPEWRQAWRVTEAMLREIGRETAAHGARFALASLTTPIQVDPDPAARRRFAARLGTADLFYPERRLAAVARAAGIPFLALAPSLQARATRERAYLHGFPNTAPGEGHWNARGHREAAALLAPWLCREVMR